MSEIDNGIKQPLRFYDDLSKQNFRKHWVRDGGFEYSVSPNGTGVSIPVICPVNSIIPFQIRRRSSPNPVTIFNLYVYDVATKSFVLYVDLFTIIPAPTTNSLRIVQMETVDNIVWFPVADFTSDLDCGLYYIHVSDGRDNWYSEVFIVQADLVAENKTYVGVLSDATVTTSDRLTRDGTKLLIKDNKPF